MNHVIIPKMFKEKRVPKNKVLKQSKNVLKSRPFLGEILEPVLHSVLVLNSSLQMVFANKHLLDSLGVSEPETVYGKTIGEIMDCVHAFETESAIGCGTSVHCKVCEGIKSVYISLEGHIDTRESIIQMRGAGDVVEYKVCSIPLVIGFEKYSFCSVLDISHEKRRKALERIFFHDVLNTAGAIQGFVGMLKSNKGNPDTCIKNLKMASDIIIDEIMAQKELLSAESFELVLKIQEISTLKLIKGLLAFYSGQDAYRLSNIIISPLTQDLIINTDPILMGRVLSNMLRNAIESSKNNEPVTICCVSKNENVEFSVHSNRFIPENVQSMIFKRSFSTKGSSRGLGTYSMKLLSERYLKGNVTFHSSEEEGTTFFAEYPKSI